MNKKEALKKLKSYLNDKIVGLDDQDIADVYDFVMNLQVDEGCKSRSKKDPILYQRAILSHIGQVVYHLVLVDLTKPYSTGWILLNTDDFSRWRDVTYVTRNSDDEDDNYPKLSELVGKENLSEWKVLYIGEKE